MNWTWIITCFSIVGVILNIKKVKWCFYIWTFTNGAWAIVDFARGIPAQGVLFTIYVALALWGIWEWRKNK